MYTGFNFFLAFPILYIGIIDQDITAETAHTFPASYAVGRLNSDLNLLNIIKYIIQALFMGCVVFLPLVHWYSSGGNGTYSAPSTSSSADGHSEGIMSLGTTTYHCLLWAMNIKVYSSCAPGPDLRLLCQLGYFRCYFSTLSFFYTTQCPGSSTFG